jgi:hypothetical protein
MALRLRRGTDAERLLITPVEGELIYTTDTKLLYAGDGTTAGGVAVSGAGGGGSTTLNALTDTDTTSVGNNNVLVYYTSTSKWQPASDIQASVTGNVLGNLTGNVTGNLIGNVTGTLDGDVAGSVFGDDSTVLVDGVANAIVGKIDSTAKIDVTTNSNVKATLTGNTNTGVTGPRIEFNTSDGTLESPTAVVSSTTGSSLGEMRGLGYDGTDYSEAGLVRVSVDLDQTVASGVVPGRIVFITANNAGSLANIMTFNSAGKLGIGTPRPDEKLHVIGNAKVDGFVQFGSLTTAERDALTAANGMVIYNTTDNKFQGYENSGWANLI